MKERLTGAIILVALIVLLVPELLTGPIRTKSAPAASATATSSPLAQSARTAPAEMPLRSYTLTLGGAQPAHEVATPAVPVPAEAGATGAQTPVESAATSTDRTAVQIPPQGQIPPQSPAESANGTRNGSSNESPKGSTNEGHARQRAMAPADTAARAEAPRLRPRGVRTGSGLQVAKSAAHPGIREARSSASSTGWVVQLGSFASRQNADRLAHSLARRGFRMSVSPARAGARVLWRVRAGPTHDRAGAQHLAARLRALGHGGELLPVR